MNEQQIMIYCYRVSLKKGTFSIFVLFLLKKSDLTFHMCFRIRISSPFHLNTLNISIQNIKRPKNTRNACLDIIFPSHVMWSLHCAVFARACQTQSVLTGKAFHNSHCLVPCFVICDQSWKWTENCVISSSKHEMCFHVFHPLSLLHFRAHQALFSTSVFRALYILNGYVQSV